VKLLSEIVWGVGGVIRVNSWRGATSLGIAKNHRAEAGKKIRDGKTVWYVCECVQHFLRRDALSDIQ